MMKKAGSFPFIIGILIISIFLMGTQSALGSSQIDVEVDGEIIKTDVSPYIDENSRTIVPARFVSEALGAEVEWYGDDCRVEIKKDSSVVKLWINERIGKIDGENAVLDTFAVLENSRTMVPMRFLAEALGFTVAWNEEQKNAVVCSAPQPEAAPIAGKASITANNVNVRTGPGTDFIAFTQLSEGITLELEAKHDDWYRLKLPDNQSGWIAEQLLEIEEEDEREEKQEEEEDEKAKEDKPLKDPEKKREETDEDIDTQKQEEIEKKDPALFRAASLRSALVMKGKVNVRSSPSRDSSIISTVKYGEWLEITDERKDWYKVNLPTGESGWIAGWLIAHRYDGEKQPASASNQQPGILDEWGPGGEPGGKDEDKNPYITGIEAAQKEDGILLTVSGNAPLDRPSAFKLNRPSRIVFDFPGYLYNTGEIAPLEVKQSPVEKFRAAQFEEDHVRIVVDLNDSASYDIETDKNAEEKVEITIKPVDTTDKTIVIDPGHGKIGDWGGTDPGAIGPSGVTERDVAMSISRYMGKTLLQDGFNVIFTRKGETALTLSERAEVANESGADIFVSIHANASPDPEVSGIMNFYYESDRDQEEKREKLASFVHKKMVELLERPDRNVRSANFSVLRNSEVPAVLVETAFISNPEEENLLATPEFRQLAAEAVTRGIKDFFAWKDN